ncbi:MAG: anti-sigma F factor [Clostridia bacterium]|nr:anti-sigma F factor [Clostridia bacterium]
MEKNYDNEMKIEFISNPNNEAFARISVASFVATLDPTIEEISDIKTAVSEAVTNSIIHGYEATKGIVTIKTRIIHNIVEIEVIDNGKGIEDIEKAKEALYTTKPELERSGMGFTIMESFMDEMQVKSTVGEGTTVFMKKIIKN